LSYKHKFRKIIEPELKENEDLKEYFDNWGSRCYAFSSELGRKFVVGKKYEDDIEQLDYNFEESKKMDGEYIISAVEINTIDKSDLLLKGIFSDKTSHYKIFLYEVQ